MISFNVFIIRNYFATFKKNVSNTSFDVIQLLVTWKMEEISRVISKNMRTCSMILSTCRYNFFLTKPVFLSIWDKKCKKTLSFLLKRIEFSCLLCTRVSRLVYCISSQRALGFLTHNPPELHLGRYPIF